MSYLGSTPASQFFAPGTDTFSGDGTTVAFTLSRNVATVNDILVVVNNVDQQPSAYTVASNVLTFSAAPSSGTNNIYVRYLSTNITAIVPSASGTANSTTFLRGDNTWAVVSVTPTAVSDQNNTSTGYFDLPSGTTAERPASPPTGGSRFNTTTGYPEYYDGTNWWQFNQTKNFAVDYIVVAGGGGSGVSYGAGGGGGGYLSGNALSIPYGGSYTVTVGAGGAGGGGGAGPGVNGSNSVFSSFTSTGGGGGGYGAGVPFAGSAGGSGGGGGAVNGSGTVGGAGTAGQGNNGGTGVTNAAAGGGGAGSVGGNGAATVGGAGASGITSTISGSSVTYAGGGTGAGTGGGAAPGTGGTALNNPGAANTGAGAGGEGRLGGSGVVIIRYSDASPDITTIGGGLTYTRTVAGGYKVYRFTAGTGTITF